MMHLFDKAVYESRRRTLCTKVGSGVIWIAGNAESPMNYKDNVYHFRQNSHFLYFFGIDLPNLQALIDIENDTCTIYGDEFTIDDLIWTGPCPSIQSLAESIGVSTVKPLSKFYSDLESYQNRNSVHYTPPYRDDHKIIIKNYLKIDFANQVANASMKLIEAIISLRSIKEVREIAEMAHAVSISRAMHLAAMKAVTPSQYEYEIVGEITKVCRAHNVHPSYGIILSVRGDVLHNHHYDNALTPGSIILNDSGAESLMHYAGDITRSLPCKKKFDSKQLDIYNLVLHIEKTCIASVKPNVTYRSIHLLANEMMLNGLKDIGLVHGDVKEMLDAGVAGLFMPHGLGHMIGLDVHDMEDLGENHVGYEHGQTRATVMGLKSLRLARTLQVGFTLTVEPGIYFVKGLIEKYKAEGKFLDFVNYGALESYYDFGGIRIEDNVVVTENGCKVIGEYIPKEVHEVEEIILR
jgi:Xaa-Pro aminopeptidase